jgi:anaerobic selenocysteine-containing dehydrogenase
MLGEAKVLHEGQERRQMVLQVKKIEGNPEHPINQGKLCARGQAGPQILYNPDRIRTPLKLSGARGSGHYQPISWDEALTLLEAKLKAVSGTSGLAAIVGHASRRRQEFIREFLAALGSDRHYQEEPPGVSVLREANRRIFGRAELEVHDLENSNYLISFGADLLEAHTSPVRYNLGLGHFRQGRAGQRGKFVYVGGRFSLSAANADQWLPARPGTEGKVALAMAHVILQEGLFEKAVLSQRGFEGFRSRVLEAFPPEKTAEITGIPAAKIIRVAREFARHQPGIALAGSAAVAHLDGLSTAIAVQALNVLVGNAGQKGGLSWSASSLEPQPATASRFWVEDFLQAAGSMQVLILCDADPLYNVPATLALRNRFEKIPFTVAFSSCLDDSSAYADLILPDQTFLERWDLTQPALTMGQRTISITQPIVKPLYESRDYADVLLDLARRLGGPAAKAFPDANFQVYLKRRLGEGKVQHGSFAAPDPEEFWKKLGETGVWVDDAALKTERVTADLTLLTEPDRPQPSGSGGEYPYFLQPFYSIPLGDGRAAHTPWMQELPDPMTSVVWGSWVEINPKTAAGLGIEESELVWLESRHGKIQVPAVFSVAARPDTLSMPFGQGHKMYGKYASGRGANPWEILSRDLVAGTGEPAWAATRVKISGTGTKARVVKIGYDREHTPAELHR